MHSSSRFRPAEGRHVQSSALCASCHTLTTHALGAGGAVVGTLPGAAALRGVAAQRLRAAAGGAASEARSCQDCHMPAVAEPTPIASVLGEPRPDLSRHTFVGANAFMLRMLDRHRDALGVEAPSPALADAARRAERLLTTSTATIAIGPVRVEGDTVIADVTVSNLAGHKLPTGYPSRRVWIEFTATDAGGRVVFSSGALSARRSHRRQRRRREPDRHRAAPRRDRARRGRPDLRSDDGRRRRRGDDGPAVRRALREGQSVAAARLRSGRRAAGDRRARRGVRRSHLHRRQRSRPLSRRGARPASTASGAARSGSRPCFATSRSPGGGPATWPPTTHRRRGASSGSTTPRRRSRPRSWPARAVAVDIN